MTQSIPASALVSVNPSVINAGGSALDLSGLLLTPSTRIPIGTIMPFASQKDVGTYFGIASVEYGLAANYFLGFDNSNKKPASFLMAQYPTLPTRAYLRGSNVSGLTLPQLQAINGSIDFSMNSQAVNAPTVNLSAATSFSNAAVLINAGFAANGFNGVSLGTITGSLASSVLTVTAIGTLPAPLAIGQSFTGIPGFTIVGLITGTGGIGTYSVTSSATVASSTMTVYGPIVTYDTLSGAFVATSSGTGITSTISWANGPIADVLGLSQLAGAVLSQGSAVAVPAVFMAAIINQTQNWATFATSFEPVQADALAFSAWNNSQNNRYMYVNWTTEPSAISLGNATNQGYKIAQAGYSGTEMIYAPVIGAAEAVFQMGAIASIDFTQTDGRTTMAFRGQSGLTPDVTTQTTAATLIANGYNFYGSYATANAQFRLFYPGQVSGQFQWVDSYVNQIWLNNALQLALMNLLTQVKSIPYNVAGRALIEAACLDPITAAVNFGAIRTGITLSALQIAEVNAAAGMKIDPTLSQRGWYLQVKDTAPIIRQARGSPPCTLWYMDGSSVQMINLASVEVQ